MNQQQFCNNCDQKHHCVDIYHRMGKETAPSVLSKVLLAFLLPLLIFAGVLVGSDAILSSAASPQTGHTALSLILASAAVAIYLFIIIKIIHTSGKDEQTRNI